MPQVLFYVLQASEPDDRLAFAARLSEKALGSGFNVLIHAGDAEQTGHMSQTLWSARPESFLPHNTGTGADAPIQVLDSLPDTSPFPSRQCLLINLAHAPLTGLDQFTRVAEIVIQAPDVLSLTRKNYSSYKNHGFIPETHKIR